MIKVQKHSKDIGKNSPCDISGSTVILRSYENTFCILCVFLYKRLYSIIHLLRLTLVPFWRVSKRMLFCVSSTTRKHCFSSDQSVNNKNNDVTWIIWTMCLLRFWTLIMVHPLLSTGASESSGNSSKWLRKCLISAITFPLVTMLILDINKSILSS